MSKRVANKKGGGGARSGNTWRRHKWKLWNRRERKRQREQAELDRAITARNARIAARVNARKPSLLDRAKNFLSRRT